MKFVPLSESEKNETGEGARTLRFVPLEPAAPAQATAVAPAQAAPAQAAPAQAAPAQAAAVAPAQAAAVAPAQAAPAAVAVSPFGNVDLSNPRNVEYLRELFEGIRDPALRERNLQALNSQVAAAQAAAAQAAAAQAAPVSAETPAAQLNVAGPPVGKFDLSKPGAVGSLRKTIERIKDPVERARAMQALNSQVAAQAAPVAAQAAAARPAPVAAARPVVTPFSAVPRTPAEIAENNRLAAIRESQLRAAQAPAAAARPAAASAPKPQSVLEGQQMSGPLSTEDKMLRPEFVAAIQAQLDSMPQGQRAAALARMVKRPDVYGRAAKVIQGRYAAMDKVESTASRNLTDLRLEQQQRRFIDQGLDADAALNLARQQALQGSRRRDLQQASPDIAGEVADREAARVREELKNAGFFGRVGAETRAQFSQAGLGLMNVFADITGDKQMQDNLVVTRRMVEAGQGAIPKGNSIFERSAQGAISSLAGQTPMIALSVLTGTAAPVLLQAGVQQFGNSYGEARAAGQSPEAAAARAIPMAAAEVFFERFGMEKAMAGLRKFVSDAAAKGQKVTGNQIAEYVGKAVVKELPAEMATTATQYGIDIVPGVGLNKNPSVVDLYKQLEETLRQTIIQAGVQAGTTIGAVKGVQKLSEVLQANAPKYERPDDTGEIQARLIAQSKGFLVPERRDQMVPPGETTVAADPSGRVEPTFDGSVAGISAGGVEPTFDGSVAGISDGGVDPTFDGPVAKISDGGVDPTFDGGSLTAGAPTAGAPTAGAPIAYEILSNLINSRQEKSRQWRQSSDEEQLATFTAELEAAGIPAEDAQVQAKQLLAELAEYNLNRRKQLREEKRLIEEEKRLIEEGQRPKRPFAPREEKLAALTAEIEAAGIPAEDAQAQAEQMLAEQEAQERTALAPRIVELTREFVDGGMAPQQAEQMAIQQATEEAQADEQAEREGSVGDAPTVGTADRTGAGVAGQPGSIAAPGGAGVAQPSGVDATGQTATSTVAGEGKQPGALNEKEIAEFDARVKNAKQIAQSNFATALDQVNDPMYGGDLDAAFESYRQNTLDTLGEGGEKDSDVILRAGREFDRLVEAHKAPPVAPTSEAPKTKRGRPAVLTEEEKQQRTEGKRPVQAAKAKAERALTRLTKKLDALATPPNEGDFETDEDYQAALANNRAERRETIKELLQLQADPALRGTAVGERVKAALARPDITAKEKADLKAGMEAQKRAQGEQASSSRVTKGTPDPAFNKFTNGVQALNHIIKTGNDFQKALGKRLRGFVTNVKFVVIEKGQELPAQLKRPKNARQWERSIGLYIENFDTGDRVIYVRGASFGVNQGINNLTILHELLHAATNRKVALAIEAIKKGVNLNSPLVRSATDLLRTMNSAISTFNDMSAKGKLPEYISLLADRGGVLEDPREFIAYGMTDPDFQQFLMKAKGYEEDTSYFNRFVRGIRKLFGMDEDSTNALTDLIVVTDTILSTKAPQYRARGEQVSSTAKDPEDPEDTGATEDPEKVKEAIRTQQKLDRDVDIASYKVDESQSAEEYAKAVSLLQMAQDPRKVIPAIRDLFSRMVPSARTALTYMMTTDFMADLTAKDVPELLNTQKLLQKMSGMTQTLLKAAGDLTNDIALAFRKDPALRNKLDRITHMATLAEYDPADKTQTIRNKKLDQMYDDLGPEGQRIYNRIKRHFEILSRTFSKLLDDQITQSGLPIAEQANLIKKIRAMYETGSKITPYFPLVRRGDFWLSIGKGKTRKFFMYESMGERDRAMQGFADEKVKQKPGESDAAFEKRRAQNMQDLLDSEDFVFGNNIKKLREDTVGSSQLLSGVFAEIDKANVGTDFTSDAKEQLKDAVYQLYLQTMPEQSFRKQFIHREGYAGFRTDLLRNVADTTTKMATQLARIKYASPLRNSLSQARDSIRNRPTYEPYIAAFERRVSDALSAGKPSMAESIAAATNKASFIFYLGGISSAMLQPLSLFQTGIPVLTKYGVGNAYAEMGNMLKVWKEFGVMKKNADGSFSWVPPSIENTTRSADERRAIKDMMARDLTTSTYARDALDYKATPTDDISSPKVQFAKDTVGALVLGGLMHSTERLSREAMFLAAYRLNRKAGRDHETSVDRAVEDTNEALGNYGQYNRPDFMTGAPGRVLTQFMMYPVYMTLFLGKNFVEMVKPMNGRTRWEATKKFLGTMGHTFVLGGAVGLWGFSTVMGLLGAMWNALKDDEWPEEVKNMSYELWWRTVWLKEQLGGTKIAGVDLADIIERGPVNAITGADISSRTSLNNMWLRDSKETATVRESATALAIEKAGPTANMILSLADSYDAFAQGDYKKGVLKAAPAGFRNWINAANYYKEGAKDNKGAEILSRDAFTTGDLIFQAVGFRSDLLANTQYVTFKVIGLEQKILNDRNKIMNKIDRAYREKDFKAYTSYYEDMQKFNRKYPTYEITADNLVDSLEKRQEQRAKSFRGVALTEKNVGPFAETLLPSRIAADKREEKNREEKNRQK